MARQSIQGKHGLITAKHRYRVGVLIVACPTCYGGKALGNYEAALENGKFLTTKGGVANCWEAKPDDKQQGSLGEAVSTCGEKKRKKKKANKKLATNERTATWRPRAEDACRRSWEAVVER